MDFEERARVLVNNAASSARRFETLSEGEQNVKTKKDKAEFIRVLREHAQQAGKSMLSQLQVDRLCALASWHHRTQEHRCERELTETEEARETKLEKEIAEIVRLIDAGVNFTGDPRGFTVKLRIKRSDGTPRGNTLGGDEEGWGVPF